MRSTSTSAFRLYAAAAVLLPATIPYSIVLVRPTTAKLLSKAEAQFKSNDATGAQATLTIVRNRAWDGAAPPSAFGPDFMNIMLQEYRHELTGDMSLWYNLRRTGLQIQYIKDNFGIDIPSGHDLLPIPQSAIATNPTLKQNPNY